MDPAAVPLQTLAAFNLAAFRYQSGSWQNYPLNQYMDLVGANYKQYFMANPADFLQAGAADYDRLLNALVLVARSNQLALLNGQVGLVALGSQVLSNESNIDRDMELAGAVGGAISSIYTVVSGLAGDPAIPAHEPPLPPVPLGLMGETIGRGFNKLGWHWWPSDSALITRDYEGREACANLGPCSSGCAKGAKSSADITYWPAARRAGVELPAGGLLPRLRRRVP